MLFLFFVENESSLLCLLYTLFKNGVVSTVSNRQKFANNSCSFGRQSIDWSSYPNPPTLKFILTVLQVASTSETSGVASNVLVEQEEKPGCLG